MKKLISLVSLFVAFTAMAGIIQPSEINKSSFTVTSSSYSAQVDNRVAVISTTSTAVDDSATEPAMVANTVPLPKSRLVNLSTRVVVKPGSIAIAGFVISGKKTILIREIGPSLKQFGLDNYLKSMVGPQALVGTWFDIMKGNTWYDSRAPRWWQDNNRQSIEPYMTSVFNSVGAFPLSLDSFESAGVWEFEPGLYTVLSGTTGDQAAGAILFEIYDAGGPGNLINISTRGSVYDGEGIMIGGFVIKGDTPMAVLVRGIGPGLVPHGVTKVVVNPTLEVYRGQTLVAKNDDHGQIKPSDWVGHVTGVTVMSATRADYALAGAFNVPTGSKDAALVLILDPGLYTALVKGGNPSGPEALIEIYDITP